MLSTIMATFLFSSLFAQVIDLKEKEPVVENGIEYGYIIKNEQVKSVKSEDFSRFEISVYVTNKSGCTKLYEDREGSYGEPVNVIATFLCSNATGKRLTSKKGEVKAKDFYIDIKTIAKDSEGKNYTKSTSTKAGYIFRNGQTLQDNLIVIVPKDERPVFNVMINKLRELN